MTLHVRVEKKRKGRKGDFIIAFYNSKVLGHNIDKRGLRL